MEEVQTVPKKMFCVFRALQHNSAGFWGLPHQAEPFFTILTALYQLVPTIALLRSLLGLVLPSDVPRAKSHCPRDSCIPWQGGSIGLLFCFLAHWPLFLIPAITGKDVKYFHCQFASLFKGIILCGPLSLQLCHLVL